MLKLKLMASAALLLVALCGRSEAANDLDALLKKAMEGTTTPAVGLLIIRDGRIDELAVSGLRRADQPDKVTIDDSWLIGSTGKVMTTALIARLVERDVLSWTATLEQMLPDLSAQMQPAYRTVTLVELLSHRAGLAENLRDLAYIDTFFSDTRALPAQRLDLAIHALGEPPEKAPGSEFVYSNSGFLIAAVIAERATHQSFETLIRQEVFAPLGMSQAGFGPTLGDQPRGHRGGTPVLDAPHSTDEGVPLSMAGYLTPALLEMARASECDFAVLHYSKLGEVLGPRYANLPHQEDLQAIKNHTRELVHRRQEQQLLARARAREA